MQKGPATQANVSHQQPQTTKDMELKAKIPKVQNNDNVQFLLPLSEPTFHPSLKRTDNSACSRKQSAKNSTAKYREKKKKQLSDLEHSVKQLQFQLVSTDRQIQQVKHRILSALETLAKMNQRSSNENIEIYNQLQTVLSDNNEKQYSNFVDFDKINLLLDTLKYRIGASGKERQSKLAYHYKSIVNTLFPALYRYILFSSTKKFDIFAEENSKGTEWQWTNQLINKLSIRPDQVETINSFRERLQHVYDSSQSGASKLNHIRQRIKCQCLKVEGMEDQIRQIINPIQCAHWTMFAEKYKYRSELMFELGFFDQLRFGPEDRGENANGKKRVKLSKQ